MKYRKRLLATAVAALMLLSTMVPVSATVLPPEDGAADTVAVIGDVNGDGKVDTTDARMILQHAVGKVMLDEAHLLPADVNTDGAVDTTDARLVLQYAVGLLEAFPEPFEGDIDFRFLQYATVLRHTNPTFQLFIACSPKEFTSVCEQTEIFPEAWTPDNNFFEEQAAVILLRSHDVIGPVLTIDNLHLSQGCLTIHSTIGSPNVVSDAPSTNILLFSVRKDTIQHVKHYQLNETEIIFSIYDPAEELPGTNNAMSQWFYNWLESIGYEPADRLLLINS